MRKKTQLVSAKFGLEGKKLSFFPSEENKKEEEEKEEKKEEESEESKEEVKSLNSSMTDNKNLQVERTPANLRQTSFRSAAKLDESTLLVKTNKDLLKSFNNPALNESQRNLLSNLSRK